MEEDWLSAEECIFDRDEKGELVPKKVLVEGTNKHITMIPLTAGAFKRIYKSGTEADDELAIIKHCLQKPVFTDEQLKAFKNGYRDAIFVTIMKNSDIGLKKVDDGFKKKEHVEVSEA